MRTRACFPFRCSCFQCSRDLLKNISEYYCCKELEGCVEGMTCDLVREDLGEGEELKCVTEHPGFQCAWRNGVWEWQVPNTENGTSKHTKTLDRRKGALIFLEICSYCFLFWVLLTLLHWYSVCRATWQCKYLPSVFLTYTHRSPITWTLCFQTYSPWWDIDLLYLLMTREILGKRQSAPFYEWSLWPCDIKYSV